MGTEQDTPTKNEAVQNALISHEMDEVKKLLHKVLNSNHELLLKVTVMHTQMQSSDEKHKVLFEKSGEQSKLLESHDKTLNIHAFIWKLIGTGAIASFGFLAWSYATLQELHKIDNSIDRRLSLIEFVVREQGGQNKQQYNGQSK